MKIGGLMKICIFLMKNETILSRLVYRFNEPEFNVQNLFKLQQKNSCFSINQEMKFLHLRLL
ncbi:hypothetical protein M153_2990005886 [Pseudoloma neurophilia]|uniref:Uncharacterized protein n=1 Tax=Pseudoloma neurophilia TaxID=146866 RepID=A0A0R0LYB7_9MICR|nr:hypothetical protein M153_2990005886 [Pseudoloma neurophilia]